MKYVAFTGSAVAFTLSMLVFLWGIQVISGYVADHVTAYAGPRPMALETAICLSLLGGACMILAHVRIVNRKD